MPRYLLAFYSYSVTMYSMIRFVGITHSRTLHCTSIEESKEKNGREVMVKFVSVWPGKSRFLFA